MLCFARVVAACTNGRELWLTFPFPTRAGRLAAEISSDALKGRVFEVSLADLQAPDEEQAHRKIKLICEEVQGRNCLTNFHGMDLTRDKLCSLLKKWQTLIEASVDVKTTDGYTVRMFAIAFTKKRQNQSRQTSYAQSAQVRQIRAKMIEIMHAEASKCDLTGLIIKLYVVAVAVAVERCCCGWRPCVCHAAPRQRLA